MNKKLNEAYNRLSPVEQKSYNSIMTKFAKVMNQITDKTQREEFMKNFKDSLNNNKKVSNKVKKLTALALSALMLVSPIMLSGCDKENASTPVSDITIETNKDGEVVTPLGKQLAQTNPFYKESDSFNIEESNYKVSSPFANFDIQKVVNQEYANCVLNQINVAIDTYGVDGYFEDVFMRVPTDVEIVEQYNQLQRALLVNQLMDPESSFAFNTYIHRQSDDTSYQVIKKPNTFCVVQTNSDGSVLYNGYIDGVAYTDNLEYSFLPQLTDDYAVIIEQSETSSPAQIWSQGIIGCAFVWGNIEKEGLLKEAARDYSYPNSILFPDKETGFINPNNDPERESIANYLSNVNTQERLRITFDFELDQQNPDLLNSAKIKEVDYCAYGTFLKEDDEGKRWIQKVVLVGLRCTDPENIKLPTTEAEAER